MSDIVQLIVQLLEVLGRTPLPIILVIAGIISILLSFTKVLWQVTPAEGSERPLRVFGGILLVFGIAFYAIAVIAVDSNGPPSTPTRTLTATSTPTLAPTHTPTPTAMFTPTSSNVPTATVAPTPSSTPPPVPPLTEIFPQVDAGEVFVYKNQGGVLIPEYTDIESCWHSGQYGLELQYNMSGEGNGGWGIHWDNAPEGQFDASQFSALVFWVRGASGSETFQIGLADTNGNEVKVESKDLAVVSDSEWRRVVISLDNLNRVDLSAIQNVNLGFNSSHGAGDICIDDIAFEQ